MKTTTVNNSNPMAYYNYDVPGNGLTVSVEINVRSIRIIPGRMSNDEKVKGTSFVKRHTVTYYEFPVDAYKAFWKEFSKSEDATDNDYYERMRAAMNYALRKYQARYGRIFA